MSTFLLRTVFTGALCALSGCMLSPAYIISAANGERRSEPRKIGQCSYEDMQRRYLEWLPSELQKGDPIEGKTAVYVSGIARGNVDPSYEDCRKALEANRDAALAIQVQYRDRFIKGLIAGCRNNQYRVQRHTVADVDAWLSELGSTESCSGVAGEDFKPGR